MMMLESTHRARSVLMPNSTVIRRFPAYTYAFQPIVDALHCRVVSYEALIRGPASEPAPRVLGMVPPDSRFEFDRDSRSVAIEQGMKLGLDCDLNLNFMPQGLQLSRDAIQATLEAAGRHNLPVGHLTLEVSENQLIADPASFGALLNEYRSRGMKVAIDDFGAGFAGLNLLADFQPDQVKIDMSLVRGIEKSGSRQAIVRAVLQVSNDLGIEVVAEGVETSQEYLWLLDHGIRLFQGYLFAKPGFEVFPTVGYPRAV